LYTPFPGFHGSAKGQLYEAVMDFHCPFLSERLSESPLCCGVNHAGKLDFFLVAERCKALTGLWQGKLIYDGDLLVWLLVQTDFYKVTLCWLNSNFNVLKWKTYFILQSLFQDKLSSVNKAEV